MKQKIKDSRGSQFEGNYIQFENDKPYYAGYPVKGITPTEQHRSKNFYNIMGGENFSLGMIALNYEDFKYLSKLFGTWVELPKLRNMNYNDIKHQCINGVSCNLCDSIADSSGQRCNCVERHYNNHPLEPTPTAPVTPVNEGQQEFKKGQKVYLKENTNVSQVVDDPNKNWGELWQANEGQQQPVQGEGFTGGDWYVKNTNVGLLIKSKQEGQEGWQHENVCQPYNKDDAKLIAEAKNMYYALKNAKDIMTTYKLMNSKTGAEIEAILTRINKQ